LASESAAAKSGGAACPHRLRKPPIAGPKMKPRPNAAPSTPIPRARFSRVVVSAMNAWAVETVAPATPAKILDAKSSASESASPKRRYEPNEPASPSSRIGRRPSRSDRRPQTGMKTNCIAENDADSSATVCALPPKRSA
jgi:hypothetical protein